MYVNVLVSAPHATRVAPEQPVWHVVTQPGRDHLNRIILKMTLVTYKSDVRPIRSRHRCLSVPGATMRGMGTLSDISDTNYELPLSEADQTALRPVLLHDLAALPFRPGALISRSLWVIFIGRWGIWTHATLPVDNRLDMPDKENITKLCDLVGSLIRPPLCHDDEKAMVVLRRPGSVKIGEVDRYIFRLVRQASIGRVTAPWAFYLVGPDGIREVTEDEGPSNPAA